MAIKTLRTDKWKLNIYPTAGDRKYGQLFDLENDPGELVNLYNDPAYRDTKDEMLHNLIKRLVQDADPLPLLLTQY
jgi:arylsulfatase A-like enzyme